MLLVREEEELATRKEDLICRRTERERAKAQQTQDAMGDIPDEDDDEREERHSGMVCRLSFIYITHSYSTQSKFTSHTVPSRPSNLIRHTEKVHTSSALIEHSLYQQKQSE